MKVERRLFFRNDGSCVLCIVEVAPQEDRRTNAMLPRNVKLKQIAHHFVCQGRDVQPPGSIHQLLFQIERYPGRDIHGSGNSKSDSVFPRASMRRRRKIVRGTYEMRHGKTADPLERFSTDINRGGDENESVVRN